MKPKKLVRKVLPKKGVRLAEEGYRKARIYGLQARFGFPARGMKVIGVTGTNGKTTTCSYINEVLKAAGYKTAMYTTAVIEMTGEREPNLTHRTVPLTADLLRFFKTAKKRSVDFVVLEVSSQALHQHKTDGIPFEVGVMTNLTQEHLDYHHDMRSYAEAKARLFNSYSQPRYAILNHDDGWYEFFKDEAVGSVISYGQHSDSMVHMGKPGLTPAGGDVRLSYKGKQVKIHTDLLGDFNCYNAAAAASVGLVLDVSPEAITEGIANLHAVPGRMEPIQAGQNFTVLVDYAVTPDALEKMLGTLKQITTGKVCLVFGATGDRDKTKRPVMGEVAAKYADRIYLTDDETYSEDPGVIRMAVFRGIDEAGGAGKTTEIADRRAAIKQAFKEARKGDVVVLAGIGHQNSRVMGSEVMPWDERVIARKLLTNTSK